MIYFNLSEEIRSQWLQTSNRSRRSSSLMSIDFYTKIKSFCDGNEIILIFFIGLYLGLQTVGLVDEDDEQNEFLDENVDEDKRDGLKVPHWSNDLERGGDESHKDVDDGHEHDQTQGAVDQLDQPAG